MRTGAVIALSSLAIVGIAYIRTVNESNHFVFLLLWLLPILVSTWLGGARAGLALTLLTTACWLVTDARFENSGADPRHGLLDGLGAILFLGMSTASVIFVGKYRRSTLDPGGIERESIASLQAVTDKCANACPPRDVTDIADDRLSKLSGVKEALQTGSLFEHLADGTLVIDQGGLICEANSAAEKIFNRTKAELLGFPFGNPVFMEDQADITVLAKGGREVHVSMRSADIIWEGAPASLASIRDVTEERKKNASLRNYMLAIEQSPVFVAFFNHDGQIAYANAGALRLLNQIFSPTEGQRNSIHDLLVSCVDDEAWRTLSQAIEECKQWHGHLSVRVSGGEVFIFDSNLTPVNDEATGLVTFVLVQQDISQTIRLQDTLENHAKMLEQRVTERTAALMTAIQETKEANLSKSMFLANMSHEMRTPLNAILGFGQMLERQSLHGKSSHLVNRIRSEGASLLGLINNVLDLSRIDSGVLEVENTRFQLLDVLDRVKGRVEAAMGISSRRVSGPEWATNRFHAAVSLGGWTAPEGVNGLIGDPLRLTQVLTNLVDNALKFTARGHVDVSVTLVAPLDAHATLRFVVTDTGVGIAQDKLQEIFQPFQQADISTTRLYGGSGLGLAIAQRLVSAMGGELVASSTPGQGSCFEFTLRLAVDDRADGAEQGPARAAGSASAEKPGQRLRAVRVLLVDDLEVNREVARMLLVDEGATVSQAEDGQQALDWLHAHSGEVDVVLMDVQMPAMDGYEATRSMRSTPALAALPVICLSAGAFTDQRQAALAVGMSDFITKPFEIDDLVDCIRRQLDAGAKSAPEARPTALPEAAPGAAPQPFVPALAPDYPGLDEARALKVWRTPAQLARYLDLFAKTLEAAQAQLRSNDVGVVSACAHKLKGAAGNLGLDELVERAKALEDVLSQGADSAASLAALEAAISSALQTIHRYTSTHAARPEGTP